MRAPEFWRRDGLLSRLLVPASLGWLAVGALRAASAAPARAGVPVICVGNVVAGGAGKTPVALAVAERLRRHGGKPSFLSRGYGGTLKGPVRVDPAIHSAADVGDEPLLLAAAAPTWVARDRLAGARAAAADGADIVVMDDGFQNRTLHKDLSLLVVDGAYGFGNGRIIPAGPLREPVKDALDRADALAVIGDDTASAAAVLDGPKPVLSARFVPLTDSDEISGRRVVAFAGIGRPEKFFETLAGMDCDIVRRRAFPDHHPYAVGEVMALVEMAAAAGAVAVTTEKDAVRLPPESRNMVQVLRVALEWRDPEAVDRLLAKVLDTKA